jgi:hypothetical protein
LYVDNKLPPLQLAIARTVRYSLRASALSLDKLKGSNTRFAPPATCVRA